MRAKRALQWVFTGHILFLQWLCTYMYVHSHIASFLYSILCVTAACIAMPCLNIDTSRRVVFCRVFLKSSGYWVSQIKNWHGQAILIASISSYHLPTNWKAKHVEVNGDSIANKGSILHMKR